MNNRIFLTPLIIAITFLSEVKAQQTAEITPSGIGYLQYLPAGYGASSSSYPVVISLHGIMEKGTSSTNPAEVMEDLHKVAKVGLARYVKQGKKFPFILISPQLKSNFGLWPPDFIMEVVRHVKRKLRIDDRRVYLTGLSLGGFGVWKTAGEYPREFAAIAAMCAGGNAIDKADEIAAADLAVWGFHGTGDHVVSYRVTTNMINAINSAPKKPNPLAKVTLFEGMGHNVWDRAYLETNVLDWMLSFRRDGGSTSQSGSSSEEPANRAPHANAGSDQTLTLPDNTLTLRGSGSDQDGRIASFRWSKVSGGNVTMQDASQEALKLADLREGEYVFRLTVKDDAGASDADEVKVTVKGAANERPTVNAGRDRTITLPTNSVTLEADASDSDGNIERYHWTQESGPGASLDGTSSAVLKVSALREGTHVFKISVRDDDGDYASDEVTITVQAGANNRPSVNAGGDRTITLPANAVRLAGSASDNDGDIAHFRWTQTGGAAAQLRGASSSTLEVSGLSEGTYTFRLTVKDNDGAQASDDVRVTVRKGAEENAAPFADAGADKTVTLPQNSLALHGNATDEDGSVSSVEWTKVSGPNATVSNRRSPDISISGLQAGTYVFRLTVQDDDGARSSDEVRIHVVHNWSDRFDPSDYDADAGDTRLSEDALNLDRTWSTED